MTTKQLVAELKSQGYAIEYSTRKDGGILVKSINGVKYQKAEGNKQVRLLTGIPLSEKKSRQLSSIKPPKLMKLDNKILNQIRRINRKLKNASVYYQKNFGRITRRHVRYLIESYGWEYALTKLKQRELYLAGYAYDKNVRYILIRLQGLLEQYESGLLEADKVRIEALKNLINKIQNESYSFKEKWIQRFYEEIYKAEQGTISLDTLINTLNSIMR